MADKPKLKYCVVSGFKPGTQITVLRPQIVGGETLKNEQVVEFAINNSFVRGKYEDVLANWYGLIQTASDLVDAGYDVNFADWLRIHKELTGAVGDDGKLTALNALAVRITPLLKFKESISIDNFSWENVDDTGLIVKVDSVLTPNGENGMIKQNGNILMTGKNLQLLTGDTVTAFAATQPSVEIPVAVTESDYAHILCSWPAGLTAPIGTVVNFRVRGRAGDAEGAVQTSNKEAVIVAA